MIGLAKRNEEIFKPGFPDPIVLPRNSKGLHLVQRIRDEAHRFAITFHRSLRGKTVRASVLNQIPGIGPTRRRALIRHFGSTQSIKDATIEELLAAPSMNTAAAKAVYVYFHSVDTASPLAGEGRGDGERP
jgi:excinuclease ABC subunit C